MWTILIRKSLPIFINLTTVPEERYSFIQYFSRKVKSKSLKCYQEYRIKHWITLKIYSKVYFILIIEKKVFENRHRKKYKYIFN